MFLDLKAAGSLEVSILKQDWGEWVIFPVLTLTSLTKS